MIDWNNVELEVSYEVKNDIVTKGMRIPDEAIDHLKFLLKKQYPSWKGNGIRSSLIRFYCMGYATGVQLSKK